MDALEFIEKQGKTRRQPCYVISGDEDFLKRQVLEQLVPVVLGEADPEYAVTNFAGDRTDFSTVRNELDSVSFFSNRRLVIIDQADAFVTRFRPQLEAYVASPSEVGTLVLELKSFPATTKLAKAIPPAGQIVCKSPGERDLAGWCAKWCQSRYGKKLSAQAAQLLVQLAGGSMGVLDQEMQKLTDYVGDRPSIELKDVDELTGKSRGANVFRILDCAANGQPAKALQILTELFEEGDPPLKILGALGSQLRKLAQTARMHKGGMNLDEAMSRAGIGNWPRAREEARQTMRHLGTSRLDQLYSWLIEVDAGLKGGSPLPDRMQLERLVVRLARPRT